MSTVILSLLSSESLDTYRHSGFWRDDTIYSVAAGHARISPNAFAVRDSVERLTYRALINAADALARDMSRLGVKPGQRVAVWLPSRAATAVAFRACSRNGYVCCPSLHRDHTVKEVVSLCERMQAAILIVQPGYGADAERSDIFAQMAASISLRHAYRLLPSHHGQNAAGFGALIDLGSPDSVHKNNPNRIIYLPFTSGTTGLPKGVMHSDNTLLANARSLSSDWRFDSKSVIYTLSPLSHNLGLGALIASIVVGGELVVHDIPRGHSLLDRIVETEATFMFGVPTHAIDLLGELRERSASRLGKVTGFRISGAAPTPEVIGALMHYGIVPQSGYGMTETCSHQYTMPEDDPKLITDTCGRACPGFEVRIWKQDNPNIEAAIGEVGQIGGRGASLMLGYFDDQKTTEESFNAHGWFLTGDLGWLDENGYLRIAGRKKDLIIRGGHNIYPARIEALAMQHQAIDNAVAFPVSDERLGERVCLAVLLKNGQQLDATVLLAHLDDAGLSKFDMPEFILYTDTFPTTASGKILKRVLSEKVQNGQLKPMSVRFQRDTVTPLG
jgi:acyl-CoA synthetase (AMP-forming)/AMP-acid ligase II